MQMVIDVQENWETQILNMSDSEVVDFLYAIVSNGTPIPKGHGRLIDADALEYDIATLETDSDIQFEYIEKQDVADAPTIIEADGGIK